MKGDFSRLTFDAKKHFSTVRMQQGRVQLDADWNEQLDISQHRLAMQMADFIGYSGVPMLVDGQDSSFKITLNGTNLKIGAGRIYIAGELYENEKEVNFTVQADYPGATLPIGEDKKGTYLAYLDVWPRHITPLEDADIREVALGGPDTTTRIKNLWQVKLQKVKDDATFALFGSDWQPDWVKPISTGQIKARVNGTSVTLENQLYRVEIHQGGSPDQATFKWSRDNGSVAAKVESIVGKTITISSAGRDSEMGFTAGQWVELRSEEQTLFGQLGTLVRLQRVQENQLIIVGWPTGNPPDAQLVRRWDSQEGNSGRGDLPIKADGEGWITLEDEIQVQFETDSAKIYKTGDYWLIPARHLTSNIEWPRDDKDKPQYQAAHGTRHHYAALALLNYDGNQWSLKPNSEDLRTKFNPLVGGFVNKAGDTISGSLRVTQKLQVNGNVGIGMAASDEHKLKVVGNTDLQGTLTVSSLTTLNDAFTVADGKNTILGGQLTVKGTTTLQEALIVADGKNTTLGAQLTVKGTTTLQEALTVANDKSTTLTGQLTVRGISDLAGNVSIGMADPGSSKLKIANSTTDFAHVCFDGQNMGELKIVGWSNGWNINAMTNGKHLYLNRDAGTNSNVLIGRGGSELFIRGDGHVGIGTTNLGNHTLKVVGNTELDGTLAVTGATILNQALTVNHSENHLRLLRGSNEQNGGNQLFLELHQDDTNPPQIPLVYPSIRFHHGYRYSRRIEGRDDGFYFKDGHLGTDDLVKISAGDGHFGGNVGIGTTNSGATLDVRGDIRLHSDGTLYAPGGVENLRLIRGTVGANGNPMAGTGFSANKLSTGLYEVGFINSFNSPPSVVATQQYPESNNFADSGGNTRDNCVIIGVSNEKFRIKCGDRNGDAQDRRFHFIVMGPR